MEGNRMMLKPNLCTVCVHASDDLSEDRFVCSAFPDGIPDEIYIGRFDHRDEFQGDRGFRFAPDPGEPANQVAGILADFDKRYTDS